MDITLAGGAPFPHFDRLVALGQWIIILGFIAQLTVGISRLFRGAAPEILPAIAKTALAWFVITRLPAIGAGAFEYGGLLAEAIAGEEQMKGFLASIEGILMAIYQDGFEISDAFSLEFWLGLAAIVCVAFAYISKYIVLEILWPLYLGLVVISGTFSVSLATLPGLRTAQSWALTLLEAASWPLIFQILLGVVASVTDQQVVTMEQMAAGQIDFVPMLEGLATLCAVSFLTVMTPILAARLMRGEGASAAMSLMAAKAATMVSGLTARAAIGAIGGTARAGARAMTGDKPSTRSGGPGPSGPAGPGGGNRSPREPLRRAPIQGVPTSSPVATSGSSARAESRASAMASPDPTRADAAPDVRGDQRPAMAPTGATPTPVAPNSVPTAGNAPRAQAPETTRRTATDTATPSPARIDQQRPGVTAPTGVAAGSADRQTPSAQPPARGQDPAATNASSRPVGGATPGSPQRPTATTGHAPAQAHPADAMRATTAATAATHPVGSASPQSPTNTPAAPSPGVTAGATSPRSNAAAPRQVAAQQRPNAAMPAPRPTAAGADREQPKVRPQQPRQPEPKAPPAAQQPGRAAAPEGPTEQRQQGRFYNPKGWTRAASEALHTARRAGDQARMNRIRAIVKAHPPGDASPAGKQTRRDLIRHAIDRLDDT